MKIEFDNNEIVKIFQMYEKANSLKNLLRSGWLKWGISEVRVESVAEHVYGCCMLATAVLATKKFDLDIGKIFSMIAVHEMEEILIFDITPYDDIASVQSKKEKGKIAVEEIFDGYEQKDYFLNLIKEFEEQTTEEAKFVRQIDKLETDLQAYLYEGHYNFEKSDPNILQDERIKKFKADGHTCVSQFFLQHDKVLYEEPFKSLAKYLEELENKNGEKYGKKEDKT